MTTTTAQYSNGQTLIAVPQGIDPESAWLLVNGQVLTVEDFSVYGGALVVDGVDLTDQHLQVVDHPASEKAGTDPDLQATLKRFQQQLTALSAGQGLSVRTLSVVPVKANTGSVLTSSRPIYGMDWNTGQLLSGIEHIHQSISDILLTPVGSRVMRRDYGSRLLDWLGFPALSQYILQMYSEIARVLKRWEPRISLQQVQAIMPDNHAEGVVGFTIHWELLPAYRWMAGGSANDAVVQYHTEVAV